MNILTVDVEDWFHISFDKNFVKEAHEKDIYKSRIEKNLLKILDLFDVHGYKGTFFCLGWIAWKYPDLINQIAQRGHELGCHSYDHLIVENMGPEHFLKDTLKAKEIISDVSGTNVVSYRAPCFSITNSVNWAFDILVECGFEIDCSIFPAKKENGGYVGLTDSRPFIVETNKGNKIKELPVSLKNFGIAKICYSGGGYFRLFPYSLISRAFKKSSYNMFYIHPRDIDSDQPVLDNLSHMRRFKSYYGLSSCKEKISKLLSDFDFIPVGKAISRIDWEDVPVVMVS